MDIFGEYFPESIINWGCDDWYNWVYRDHFYPLVQHVCLNEGGSPRYVIDHDDAFDLDPTNNLALLREKVMQIAIQDRVKIQTYLTTRELDEMVPID